MPTWSEDRFGTPEPFGASGPVHGTLEYPRWGMIVALSSPTLGAAPRSEHAG